MPPGSVDCLRALIGLLDPSDLAGGRGAHFAQIIAELTDSFRTKERSGRPSPYRPFIGTVRECYEALEEAELGTFWVQTGLGSCPFSIEEQASHFPSTTNGHR